MMRGYDKLPPSLMEPLEVESQPCVSVKDGALDIVFKTEAPGVRVHGKTFRVDEKPCVIVGGKKMEVSEVF